MPGEIVRGIGAYLSAADGWQTVILGRLHGCIEQIRFDPARGIFPGLLSCGPRLVGVAGYFTPPDGGQHVIVATDDGRVRELYFVGGQGISVNELGQFPGVVGVAGYFTPPDGGQHVIVATDDGRVRELYFVGGQGVTATVLATLIPLVPAVESIGPYTPNHSPLKSKEASPAGLIIAISGDSHLLYALSLNAGVWRSTDGSPWEQMEGSPPRANCLAVNPNNPLHVVVGERDGDATQLTDSHAGVWESIDGGSNWTYLVDPLKSPGCSSQAIPALVFSQKSTLFVATSCGIGRRPQGSPDVSFDQSPPGLDAVTALSISRNRVWARTATRLLTSNDDGITWTIVPIPSPVSGFAIKFTDRGDLFSLGAFDFAAYMSAVGDTNPGGGRYNLILSYNLGTNTWSASHVVEANGSITSSGTGLGGRRYVKSYELNRADLPGVVGQRLQLYYGAAQNSYSASSLDNFGNVTHWTQSVGQADPVHSDFWDFHVDPSGKSFWLGGDGGIFVNEGSGWQTMNAGLRTHEIESLAVLPSTVPGQTCLAYATGDNGAWRYDPTHGWATVGAFGDANWAECDTGNQAIALLSRNKETPVLTRFTGTFPGGARDLSLTLNKQISLDDGTYHRFLLQFIQTPVNEQHEHLDAILLQFAPVRPGAPSNDAVILLRNEVFPEDGQWRAIASNLPIGTKGFWVSGGHAHPVLYVYAVEATEPVMYKSIQAEEPFTQWIQLQVTDLLDAGKYGPAFVNPFDPDWLYVLTRTGVLYSSDGGRNFNPEAELTSLLTGNGKFPMTGIFRGGNPANVAVGDRFRGSDESGIGTLSYICFLRENPREAVASSPFTGVFYSREPGQWLDVTPWLPKPFGHVRAVSIDCEAIHVATRGRGLVRINNYRTIS